MKLCVIDIGTNSIHVIYAQVEANGYFQVLGSDKEMIELGEKPMLTQVLPTENQDLALNCLKRFKYFAHRRQVDDIIVVATSAVREAKNGLDFVKRIREETKLKVHVIDGKEEARLIALAVQNSVALGESKSLIVDIGGGSTECIIADQRQIDWLDSFKLGSNRLKQLFTLSDPAKSKELEGLESHVASTLKPLFKQLESTPVSQVVATSGTLNTAYKILTTEGGAFSNPETAFEASSLLALYKKISGYTLDELKKIKGLSKKRAPMFIQGLSIAKVILERTSIKRIIPCDKALREGIIYDYLARNRNYLVQIDDSVDLRRRSVYGLIQKYNVNLVHAEQTAKLSLQIFDALAPDGHFLPKERELLEYAALMHDTGYHISFSKHHRHSFYLILNSDLAGFLPEEVETMAWVARFHRLDFNRKQPEFLKLPQARQDAILRLAACLRLADGFDCSHFAVIQALKINVKGSKMQCEVVSKNEVKWEILEAKKRGEFFEKVFNKTLEWANEAI